MKLEVKVTALGELVSEMKENNIYIIFDDNAPAELAEIAVLHTRDELAEEVAVGDQVTIGELEYTVADIGEEANKTLKSLGHCTLRFEAEKVGLPGEICLTGNPIPDIQIGDTITIK